MGALTGTGRLIRLALRRDRVKLPMWILAIIAFMTIEVPAINEVYGKTEEARMAYATTTASSLVSRLFGGPIGGPELGEILNNETFAFMAVLVAFMSTLLIVRHTRQNEETGRSEIIASAVVGRNAALTAALIVALGANVVAATLLALTMIGFGLPAEGSIATATAYGAIGICFAGIAAITAQVADSARSANGLAAAAVGIFFLLRAVGDALGKINPDGMSVTSSWPSWLSPIGWGQQIHGFVQANWAIFGLFGAFIMLATATAYYLNAKRDVGLGMLPARKGSAYAARSLLSTWGLARRLQRGTLIGWSIVFIVMGLTTGLISKEFASFFDSSPELRQYLEAIGGGEHIHDVLFSAMTALMGITAGAYVIHGLQRMRSEESNGHLEPVLGTSVNRKLWVLSHFVYVATGAVIVMVLFGISTGVAYLLVEESASLGDIWRLTIASLAYVPALLVIGGAAALTFGLLPRATVALSWLVFVFCLFVSQFGELLKIPQVIVNISPFTHIPPMPSEPFAWLPATILTSAGLLLLAAALLAFRHRDLTTA